jgi:DNA invertase Pin-like site-specific DNA recombinase
MPRQPSHESSEGRRWFGALRKAQTKVERAERDRDELAREAFEHGLSARSVATALNIDAATAWRRYARGGIR